MQYVSTRGQYQTGSGAEALLLSHAPDGGLLVPDSLPFYDEKAWASFHDLPWIERMAKILSDFLPDLTLPDLQQACRRAYSKEGFGVECGTRIQPMNPYVHEEYLLELWQGPTGSLADFSFQLILELIALAQKSAGRREGIPLGLNAVHAAAPALFAARGKARAHTFPICLLTPQEGLNPTQKKTILSLKGGADRLIVYKGTGEKGSEVLQSIQDSAHSEGSSDGFSQNEDQQPPLLPHLLNLDDSYWGRLLIETAAALSAWVDFRAQEEYGQEPINLVVPAGSLNLLLLAWYLRQMGVPIRKIIVATHANKQLASFFESGKFVAGKHTHHTNLAALDIQIPTNLERLLFECCGHDAERVAGWLKSLQEQRQFSIESDVLRRFQAAFVGGYSDERQTLKTLRDLYDRTDYCVDPITALGANVYRRYKSRSKDKTKVVYASALHPLHLPDLIRQALDLPQASLAELEEEIGVPLPHLWAQDSLAKPTLGEGEEAAHSAEEPTPASPEKTPPPQADEGDVEVKPELSNAIAEREEGGEFPEPIPTSELLSQITAWLERLSDLM